MSELRFALRQLWKSKGFTLTALATLALGIGANTAIFTLIHAVMLKSLPVADPQQLVRLGDGDNCCVIGGYQGAHFSIYSYPLYLYFRDHTPEFEQLAGFQGGVDKVGVRPLNGGAAPEPFVNQFVSGNYFSMFGIRPFAGRLLAPSDDTPGAPLVAVMSYRAWQHYGADTSILGATFLIDGAPYTIAGIAPPGFFGVTVRADPPDFWMPLADEPVALGKNSILNGADLHWLFVIGRLKPGADRARVESEVNVELRQWLLANQPPRTEQLKREFGHQHIALAPGGGGVSLLRQNFEHDLRLLMGITGLVLLIACANLANLQLARGAANLTQNAIRVALGAPRIRLVRQVLAESLILAITGGIAGLLVSSAVASLLVRFAFGRANYVPIEAAPSLPVLGFTFLLSLVTGVVFGLAPAWTGSRTPPAAVLHGAGRSTRHTTLSQKSLIVVQATLSLVLLAAAGLMVRTLHNLTDQQFGFRLDNGVVVSVNAAVSAYSPEKLATVYAEADRRLRQVPGVREAALALYSPMSGNNWQMDATLERGTRVSPAWDRVSPSFFQAIGARILRGRPFDDRDTPNATQVAIVNQAFADSYYPGEDPIGKRFGLGGIAHAADYQIVGVVNNIVFRNPRRPMPPPMFFLPLLQMHADDWRDRTRARSNVIQSIILRVAANPPDLATQIQRALAAADPNLTVLLVTNFDEQMSGQLSHELLLARLAGMFGIVALLLASVGLYGVTAYSTSRRISEIGIRTALGATRGRIITMIVRGALSQIGIGIAIGIPAALGAGELLASQLYGVKSSDPLILAAAALTLAFCAALAGLIPAYRAANTDPVRALRADG